MNACKSVQHFARYLFCGNYIRLKIIKNTHTTNQRSLKTKTHTTVLYLHGARHRSWPRSSTIISAALKHDEFSFSDKKTSTVKQHFRFFTCILVWYFFLILIWKSDVLEPKTGNFAKKCWTRRFFQRPEVTIPRFCDPEKKNVWLAWWQRAE